MKGKRPRGRVAGSPKSAFLIGKVTSTTEASVRGRQNVEVLVSGGRKIDAVLSGKIGVERGTPVLLRRLSGSVGKHYRIIELLPEVDDEKTLSPKHALRVLSTSPPQQPLEVRVDAKPFKDPVEVLVPTSYLADLIKSDTSHRQSVDPEGLDPSLWGAAPSSREVLAAEESVKEELLRKRESVIKASITRAEAAHRLGISPQSVSDWIARGEVLAFQDGREWRIPAWQFEPTADRGLKVGLKELALAFGGGVVGLSIWATTQQADFAGKTPADTLRAATLSKVVNAAKAVGHVW